jgi:peroxiredoxin
MKACSRKKWRAFHTLALGACLLLMGAVLAPAGPQFQNTAGDWVSLAHLMDGQPTAVVVIKHTQCPVCAQELIRLNRLGAAFKEQGIRVIALSNESPKNNLAYQKRHQLNLPLFSDPRSEALLGWGLFHQASARVIPGVVFFDRCGEVALVQKGRRPGQSQTRGITDLLKHLRAQPKRCGLDA